jgi:LmbE family N-acetylglucosaminyl deacetylase
MTMTITSSTTDHAVGVEDLARLGTIVGVWAHPDDEAYLSAGLMAAAVERGQRVLCVTATHGERGTNDPVNWPPHRLARLREHELAASLTTLGVREHRWLDYDDGACDRVTERDGARAIEEMLVEVGADTVVTFGPDGMTGHPDHIAVGRWATDAGRDAGVATVLHATTTEAWARRFADVHHRLRIFGADGPPQTAEHDLAVALDLPARVLDLKIAALCAQPSQTSELMSLMGESVYRQWWARECFVAAPGTGQPRQRAASSG